MTDDDRPFGFLRVNRRQAKPRTRGLTEIRGPYYTPLGPRYLEDLLDTVGHAVDGLKFGGGSFAVMTRGSVRRIIELASGQAQRQARACCQGSDLAARASHSGSCQSPCATYSTAMALYSPAGRLLNLKRPSWSGRADASHRLGESVHFC